MPEKKSATHILKTHAHSVTQKLRKKYKELVIRTKEMMSRITNTDTLVISMVLLVLV